MNLSEKHSIKSNNSKEAEIKVKKNPQPLVKKITKRSDTSLDIKVARCN